jgi:MioC protein
VDQVTILYGTESGNAELVADDVAAALAEQGVESVLAGMEDYEVARLASEEFVIVITSTYGEGELPETATPFYEQLMGQRPRLDGFRFAAFGLGDSTYETFCNGIEILGGALRDLGATQLGQTGRHDASSGEDLSELATRWAQTVFVNA